MDLLLKTIKENWWKALFAAGIILIAYKFFWTSHYIALPWYEHIFWLMIGWLSVDYLRARFFPDETDETTEDE